MEKVQRVVLIGEDGSHKGYDWSEFNQKLRIGLESMYIEWWSKMLNNLIHEVTIEWLDKNQAVAITQDGRSAIGLGKAKDFKKGKWIK